MVYDTLFGVNAALQPKPQMADGHTVSDKPYLSDQAARWVEMARR
jgi:hypothetical protein